MISVYLLLDCRARLQSGENTLPACFPHSFLVDASLFSAITRFPPIMNRIQWSENTCACKCANNKRLTQALGNYSMKNGVKKRNYSIKTDLILGNYSVFLMRIMGNYSVSPLSDACRLLSVRVG